MSFDTICSGCGAPSSPSVGTCPFCKTVMGNSDGVASVALNALIESYGKGQLEQSLHMAKKMYNTEELRKKPDFLLLYAKLLIDTEGPSSLIKSLLLEAHLIEPKNTDVLDTIDFVQAKQQLTKEFNDAGETRLKELLRKSPHNIQILFTLGSHLHWVDNKPMEAVSYLEKCVQLAPNNLRAWGCLGVVYQHLKNPALANRAFQRCVELETNPTMREMFLKQIK